MHKSSVSAKLMFANVSKRYKAEKMSHAISYKPMKAMSSNQRRHGGSTAVYVWGQCGNAQLAAGKMAVHIDYWQLTMHFYFVVCRNSYDL